MPAVADSIAAGGGLAAASEEAAAEEEEEDAAADVVVDVEHLGLLGLRKYAAYLRWHSKRQNSLAHSGGLPRPRLGLGPKHCVHRHGASPITAARHGAEQSGRRKRERGFP